MKRGREWDPILLAQIKREYFSARERKASDGARVLDKYAALYKVDRSTLSRRLGLRICKRDRAEATKISRAEIDTYAHDVFVFQQSCSEPEKEFSTMSAYRVLRANGEIPASITYDQICASITRNDWRARQKTPPKRFEHGHAYSMLQVDYSVSSYFKVHSEGHVILTKNRGYYQAFKDDDGDIESMKNLRVWMMCFLDDHSRVSWAEYRITRGEDASSVQRSFINAVLAKDVVVGTGEWYPKMLYQGVPEHVYWDRGPGNKAASTLEGLEAMLIKVMGTGNLKDADGNNTFRSNKRAHGKIENYVKDVKHDFEQFMWGLFKRRSGKSDPKFVMTLDELNEELERWVIEKNQRPHPRLEGTRWSHFEEAQKSMRLPDDDALAHFAVTYRRKVTKDGEINVGKNKYALAPQGYRHHDEVLIQKEHKAFYLLQDGQRQLLAMNDGSQPKKHEELPSDLLTGKQLRDRLAAELERISDGKVSLGDAKLSHKDDINCFYEKLRTLEEVKALARVIVGERKKQTANIIIAQPQ
jgi:hypothetical protein